MSEERVINQPLESLGVRYRDRFNRVLQIEKKTIASLGKETSRQLDKARGIIEFPSPPQVNSCLQESRWTMEATVAAKQAKAIFGRLKKAAAVGNKTQTEIPLDDESFDLAPEIKSFSQYYPSISGDETNIIREGKEWAKRTLLGFLERKDTPLLPRLRRDLALVLAAQERTAGYRSFTTCSGDHEEEVSFETNIQGIDLKYFYTTDNNFPKLFLVVKPL